MNHAKTAVVTACLLLGACGGQTLVTTGLPAPGTTVKGVPYFLPIGYVPITFSGGPPPKPKEGDPTLAGTYKVDVTVSATAYRPDGSAPLFLNYEHSSWAADQFSLGVDANGLLQSSSTVADDKSGAVALKVAELIGQIVTAAAGFPPGALAAHIDIPSILAAAAPIKCNLPPFTREINYYPGVKSGFPSITGDGGQQLDISIEPSSDPTDAPPLPVSAPVSQSGPPTGVLFRRAVVRPYTIRVTPNPAAIRACGFGSYADERFASVPDRSPQGLFWQDTSRATLVSKSVKLTISNGMLTGVEVNSPSEALAIVSLPSDILKALLSIPASVLTFKVQQMSDQQAVSDAQVKAIQSQIDTLQKTATLQKARADAAAGGATAQ